MLFKLPNILLIEELLNILPSCLSFWSTSVLTYYLLTKGVLKFRAACRSIYLPKISPKTMIASALIKFTPII